MWGVERRQQNQGALKVQWLEENVGAIAEGTVKACADTDIAL